MEKELQNTNKKISELQRQITEKENTTKYLESLFYCISCGHNSISSVLLGCNHAILCFECASNLKAKNCPSCSTVITNVIMTYRS